MKGHKGLRTAGGTGSANPAVMEKGRSKNIRAALLLSCACTTRLEGGDVGHFDQCRWPADMEVCPNFILLHCACEAHSGENTVHYLHTKNGTKVGFAPMDT